MHDVTIEEIRRDLRAARPSAPDELRERVLAIATRQPEVRRRFRLALPSRRLALVVVPVCLAAAVSAAAIYGLATSWNEPRGQFATPAPKGVPDRDAAAGSARQAPVPEEAPWAIEPSAGRAFEPTAPEARLSDRGALPTPSATRLQNYDVGLRLRVSGEDGLSRATQRALRITRALGGYLVHVDYNTATRARGDAFLEVRVPVTRVQTAIFRLSGLGTILAQHVSIQDVQAQADALTREIRARRARITRLQAALRNPNLTPARRAQLERRLDGARRALAALTDRRGGVVRRAQFATVSLELTTQKAAAADEQESPGRLERAVRNAGSFLVRELAFVLYALIVLSPLIVLAALVLFATRAARRRAEQRLLAQS